LVDRIHAEKGRVRDDVVFALGIRFFCSSRCSAGLALVETAADAPSFAIQQREGFARLARGARSRLVWLPTALKVAAIALAVVALARPQRADTKIKRNVEGIDIMLALDISDSMLIEDMQPENRMESSKLIIKQFIEGRFRTASAWWFSAANLILGCR
jgi:hypothetical protein